MRSLEINLKGKCLAQRTAKSIIPVDICCLQIPKMIVYVPKTVHKTSSYFQLYINAMLELQTLAEHTCGFLNGCIC